MLPSQQPLHRGMLINQSLTKRPLGDRSFISQSSAGDHSSPVRHSSSGSIRRRRSKSPGRRLTDSFSRTTEGIPVAQSGLQRRASSSATLGGSSLPTAAHLHFPQSANSQFISVITQQQNQLQQWNLSKDYTEVCKPEVTYLGSSNLNSSIYQAEREFPVKLYKDSEEVTFLRNVASEETSDTEVESSVAKRMKTEHEEKSQAHKIGMKEKKISKNKWLIYRIFCLFFKMLMRTCLISASIVVIFLSIFSGIDWMRDRCEHLLKLKFDLVAVTEAYTKHVIGQHIALNQIISTLNAFHDNEFSEPHIMWCVGWTGSGKSRSMDLLKHTLAKRSSIQYILPSFIPETIDLQSYFINDTVKRLNPCQKNIIIVDGWDAEDDGTIVPFLQGVLTQVKVMAHETSAIKQLLIAVVGVRGSKLINREYLRQRTHGKLRSELSAEAFIEVISKSPDYHVISNLAPLTVVPYLPLEDSHVRSCIKKELLHLNKLIEQNRITLSDVTTLSHIQEEDIIKQVLERITFVPSENPLMSSTGCKRVLSIIRIAVGDVDATISN